MMTNKECIKQLYNKGKENLKEIEKQIRWYGSSDELEKIRQAISILEN